ncbi:putative zinc finger protein [Orchesella cincta]|uniref:Putative zinc finger protein n=1 Tax=Orchesella cincta TaxID=48709 RepID=A0A1D2MJI0_ORCCI|nr:putative zinc finger protein [Orchesella cincta]
MPFAGLRQSEIDAHNWSHLGQEERERKEKELLNPDKETYQCQICPEIVKGKIALLVHEKTHADSRTVCSICGAAFKQKRTLDRHMEKVHSGGTWKGPFSCNYPNCSESLESDSSLLVHVEEEHASSEQARKRIMCLKCGKVLASPWAVKTHGLVHTKERNFHCDICSKTYSLKTTLEDHMAGMHGVGSKCAAFRCEQPGCGAVFRSNVYFKIHLRRIHSIYVGKGKKNVKTHRNQ